MGTDSPDQPPVEQQQELVMKKAVEQISEVVNALRANGFESLAEAAVFCAAARATVDGELCGAAEISHAAQLPNSTVSRLVWVLSKRGLLDYVRDSGDWRIRRVLAKLDAFKWTIGELAKLPPPPS